MSNRKTQRKNKTNQNIVWPADTEYFTIKSLIESNQHMLTSSGSDITLRVRLAKAIQQEKLVAEIGRKNCGKGRPELVFAMRPVNTVAVEKARTDGITIDDDSKLVQVMAVVSSTTPTPTVTPVTNIVSPSTVKV